MNPAMDTNRPAMLVMLPQVDSESDNWAAIAVLLLVSVYATSAPDALGRLVGLRARYATERCWP